MLAGGSEKRRLQHKGRRIHLALVILSGSQIIKQVHGSRVPAIGISCCSTCASKSESLFHEELQRAGYDAAELHSAGVPLSDLKGFGLTGLKGLATAQQLRRSLLQLSHKPGMEGQLHPGNVVVANTAR